MRDCWCRVVVVVNAVGVGAGVAAAVYSFR